MAERMLSSGYATFRCKVCNHDLPEEMKAAPWKQKGAGKKAKTVDLHRCVSCARKVASWNTTLKAEGQQVISSSRRPRRKGRNR